MDYKKYKDTVYQIIGAAMTVHSELRWGLLEPVYQEALSMELEACEIDNQREKELRSSTREQNWTRDTRWILSLMI